MAFKWEKFWGKENLGKCFQQGILLNNNNRHKQTGFIAAIKKIVKSKVK